MLRMAERAKKSTPASTVPEILRHLKSLSSAKVRKGMARFGIEDPTALGIPMGTIQSYAKTLGRDHRRALALWDTGGYEARMVAIYTADPQQLTVAQMNRWCRDFANWGTCDTACWVLFDKTPLAWGRLAPWSRQKAEHPKRAAFALLASLALHDRATPDPRFMSTLQLIKAEAKDERNFVKKGVNWALRSIGVRSESLNQACIALARELEASELPSARWVGKDALRYLATPAARKRVAARERQRASD